MREVSEGTNEPSLAPSPKSESTDKPAGPLWLKVLPELLVLALCVVLWIPTAGFSSSGVGGPGPAVYPRSLIILLAVAMVLRMLQQVRENRGEAPVPVDDDAPPEEGVEFDEELIDSRRVAIAIGLSVLYVLSTLFLGWTIATFILTLVFLFLAGKRNPVFIVPTALVLSLGFSYVFVKIVYISLPTGSGFFDTITVRLFEIMGIY